MPSQTENFSDQSLLNTTEPQSANINTQDAATQTDQELPAMGNLHTTSTPEEISRKLIDDEHERIRKSREKYLKLSRHVPNVILEVFDWEKETQTDSDLLKWLTRYYQKHKILF